MRRRAASHNIKRLPRRVRQRAEKSVSILGPMTHAIIEVPEQNDSHFVQNIFRYNLFEWNCCNLINSLAPVSCNNNSKSVICQHTLQIKFMSISSKIALL